MANRKNSLAAGAPEDTVDKRPHVPGLYRRLLPVVCLREIRRSPRFVYHALNDEHDPQYLAEELQITAEAQQLEAEYLAAGTPIEVRGYELPEGLPAPLDNPRFDPSPREVTIGPDDRVDASESFNATKVLYQRVRHYPNCDHAYFQAAFAMAAEFGV